MSYLSDTVDQSEWLQRVLSPVPVSVGLIVFGVALLSAQVGIGYPNFMIAALDLAVLGLTYGLVVLGLNLQVGHTGLINFGPHLYYAIGAYTTAMVASESTIAGVALGLPVPVGVVLGVVLSMVAGLFIGATSLQLRTDYLAIVTLASAEIMVRVINGIQFVFGGQTGILNVPQPIHEAAVNYKSELLVTLLILGGVLLLAYAAVDRLTSSPYGRVLRAIRADEEAAQSLGKAVPRYKLWVFIYGSALMGLAGTIVPLYNGSMAPTFTTIQMTVTVWIGMLVGGAANNRAVIGGIGIIIGLRLVTRYLQQYSPVGGGVFAPLRLVLIGAVLWAVIYYRPQGIWGDPDKLGEVFTRK
ncbi:branched-chain amino acid ABC transporter permease [Haloplanus halophilus]|uniref:branched-chain amino acid ABC transporter permease n=1 Tax=Haloplanus halophilus TaxID=2949993 RepID=UPI0020411688|nr:branched-chain amino acid ABC transporter permease [Haloplanus sp. GDY1]